MPILGVRVWRTSDGRHVPDGHLDAAVLAYGSGDDVPEHIAAQLQPEPAPQAEAVPEAPKSRPQAANKSRKPAGDK